MKRDEDGVRRWHELIEWIPVRDEIDETMNIFLFRDTVLLCMIFRC
jgi:hypothetical protein